MTAFIDVKSKVSFLDQDKHAAKNLFQAISLL